VATSHQGWEQALTALETQLAGVETLLDGTDPGKQTQVEWVPPTDLGPLPAELEPRARQLLTRQLEVAAGLTEQMSAVRNQQNLATRVSEATSPEHSRPVYLDMDA
jgi:hypothetical protein